MEEDRQPLVDKVRHTYYTAPMLRLYILIRGDITTAQQAVQAGHAVAQFAAEHPTQFKAWQEDNNTLIYLSVNNIDWWKQILADGKIRHSVFHEPTMRKMGDSSATVVSDMDTAIAVAPNWFSQYILFKDLPLAFQSKKKWWRR